MLVNCNKVQYAVFKYSKGATMKHQTRSVSAYLEHFGLPVDNDDAAFVYRLALGSVGAVLAMLWLAMLPAWAETFMHLHAGAAIQMLILLSAAVIGSAAVVCGRLAVRGLARSVADSGADGLISAARVAAPAYGLTLRRLSLFQRRTPAPQPCQRQRG
jgi:hypothetical protein